MFYLGVDRVEDVVDDVLAAWQRERPDLDLAAVGTVGRLGRVALLLGPAQEQVLARFDLQPGEFDVLASLRRAGAPFVLTPSQLSRLMLLSRAGMTHRVDRLEQARLVERTLDPQDRRSFRIRLTERGRARVDEAMTAHTAHLTHLLSGLPDADRAALDDLLRTLLRQLSEGRAEQAPVAPPA